MRWVRQRTTTDCGIAAVAMVAGVSYEDAKAALDPFPGRGFHTEALDLRRALKRLGVRLSKKARPMPRSGRIALFCDSIVLVGLGGRRGDAPCHWIVWDVQEWRVLDPARLRPKELYPAYVYYRVKSRIFDVEGDAVHEAFPEPDLS